MKIADIDHGEWTERQFEPDKSSPGNGKAHNDGASVDPWPVLNPIAYHGLAGRVVATILPHTESDPVALLLQFLVSFGNVVGRYPYYFIEGAKHYPSLYTLLAGPTAKARKGTSAQHKVDAVRGPVAFDDMRNPIQNIYIKKVEKKKLFGCDKDELWNTVIKIYPHVSQFWT